MGKEQLQLHTTQTILQKYEVCRATKLKRTWNHLSSQPINQLKKRQADSDHSTHGPSVITCYLVERSHVKEKMAPRVVKDVEHANLWRVKACQNAY